MTDFIITNTRPEHAEAMARLMCLAYNIPPELCNSDNDTFDAQHIRQQIARFPEGHFVALDGDIVVGMGLTMRTNYPPDQPAHKWHDMIGDFTLANHDPNGEWLYGVEFAVHPDYRGRGIGVKLYEPRFALFRRLGLRGYYAVGMLMGYHRYQHQMSVREYGEKVIRRELTDPTVTMQIHRGFQPLDVVENYLEEPAAGNAGVLILIKNDEFVEK